MNKLKHFTRIFVPSIALGALSIVGPTADVGHDQVEFERASRGPDAKQDPRWAAVRQKLMISSREEGRFARPHGEQLRHGTMSITRPGQKAHALTYSVASHADPALADLEMKIVDETARVSFHWAIEEEKGVQTIKTGEQTHVLITAPDGSLSIDGRSFAQVSKALEFLKGQMSSAGATIELASATLELLPQLLEIAGGRSRQLANIIIEPILQFVPPIVVEIAIQIVVNVALELSTVNLQPFHSGKCVGVLGGNLANGVAAVQWSCLPHANQEYFLLPTSDGYLNLVALHSQKCLEVSGYSSSDGALVHQWQCTGGDNQKFSLLPQWDGTFSLKAKHSGKCLDVWGVSNSDGALIAQSNCHGGGNQRFWLNPLPQTTEVVQAAESLVPPIQGIISPAVLNSVMEASKAAALYLVQEMTTLGLRPKHSGKCIGVAGNSGNDGAAVLQTECNALDQSQDFYLVPTLDGWLNIKASHSGKCLDVSGISLDDGAPVHQWNCWGGDNQKFALRLQEDGSFRLSAKHSGKCLDVRDWSQANGAVIQQYSCDGGENQKFDLSTW